MSKKLVVRINNIHDIETSDDYDVTEETEIRWDRVISVAIAGVLLLVALVFGAWYFFSADKPNVDSSTAEPVAVDTRLQLAAEQSPEPLETLESQQVNVATVVEVEALNGINEGSVNDNVQPIESQNSQPIETHNAAVDVEPKPDIVVDASDSTKLAGAPSLDAPVLASVTAKMTEDSPKVTAVLVDPITIKSNRIVKAQLTHGVSKSEPVDQLGDRVSMGDDKLIKIFLFTAMEGLKGETLYYDWYLSDKRMARVKVNVRSNKTTASSSKFIDQYMMGDWRVTVSTSRGDELATAQFSVTP